MSIHGHSTPTAGNSYVIFCLDDGARLPASAIGAKKLQGSWRGTVETSYIVTAETWEAIVWGLTGCCDTQESVLVLGPIHGPGGERPATLHWLKPHALPEALGYFVPVTEAEARTHDGWTYDPQQDQYFICEHRRRSYGLTRPAAFNITFGASQ